LGFQLMSKWKWLRKKWVGNHPKENFASWSEPAATSAPVQDEAIWAVLGMNRKHILFPCPGIFQPPSLPQKFPLLPTCPPILPPSYLLPTDLPPLSSLTSFLAPSIPKVWESSWAWVA
jgi:hypothetical protein